MMRCLWIVLLICLAHTLKAQCSDSIVNCTGECGQFSDTDHDGYCDDSIHDTTAYSHTTVTPTAVPAHPIAEVLVTPEIVSSSDPAAIEPTQPLPARSITRKQELVQETKSVPVQSQQLAAETKQPVYLRRNIINTDNSGQRRHGNRYDYAFLTIAVPVVAAWVVLQLLSAKKIIRRSVFLRIWNTALLLSFLVSAILGLVITAKLVYGFALPAVKTIYMLHVDFGVAMAVISLFHLVVHWKYYRNILRG